MAKGILQDTITLLQRILYHFDTFGDSQYLYVLSKE